MHASWRPPSASPARHSPASRAHDHDAAIAWYEQLGRPGRGQARRPRRRQGRHDPRRPKPTPSPRSGATTEPFLLEERMSGPECSLIALCDGTTAVALPLAQDHKRIGEGDTGPNTGGMGAYAPAPVPYDADDLVATFVQPILDHFAAAGTPVRRRALRRADAHRRRPAPRRVQRPLRRPRGAGPAAPPRRRPRGDRPRRRTGPHRRRRSVDPRRRRLHRGRRRRRLPRRTAPRRRRDDPDRRAARRCAAVPGRAARRPHERWPGARRHRTRRRPRRRHGPRRTGRSSRSTSPACSTAATSAGEHRAPP